MVQYGDGVRTSLCEYCAAAALGFGHAERLRQGKVLRGRKNLKPMALAEAVSEDQKVLVARNQAACLPIKPNMPQARDRVARQESFDGDVATASFAGSGVSGVIKPVLGSAQAKHVRFSFAPEVALPRLEHSRC